jgi:glucokinase
MLLGADIGGTKTTLALFEPGRSREPQRLKTYPSREHTSLGDILDSFLAQDHPPITAACFGVAGPVVDHTVHTTNLPWTIEADRLSEQLGGVPVFLLNDLEALAWGVTCLPHDRCPVLNPGRASGDATMAVIAAGTGLGEAGILWTGDDYLPFPSEGGHADFAPRSEREIALVRHLLGRFGHVSVERVLSGPGMVNLFEFLRDVEGREVPPALAAAIAADDPAAAITDAALAGGPPIAVETLALFASIYGAEAGNLALTLKATGGVWVGGGIAPKIRTILESGGFREAFVAKGRFRGFVSDVPVRLILDGNTALYGTACYASRRVGTR